MEKILREATNILKMSGSETARLDAELLLSHVISSDRVGLYSRDLASLSQKQKEEFMQLVARRALHEPVAYILGGCEFYGYQFRVNRHVLIPRSDTELLVDHALLAITELSMSLNIMPRVLDVGTGSGCIAVTLQKKGGVQVVGWDKSSGALEVAQYNNEYLNTNVCFELKDVFDDHVWGVSKSFNLIVSNPPYISLKEKNDLHASVLNFEPEESLFGGEDGLEFYRCISHNACRALSKDGWLILEIGYSQGADIIRLLKSDGWINTSVFQDLNGLDRVVIAKYGD